MSDNVVQFPIQRAHAILEVKATDDPGAPRRISGIATTPHPDRQGDLLDPLGATFVNPIPLLLHHNQSHPIGKVTLHAPTPDGIRFDATIATVQEPGALRDRLDEAWQAIKAGLITGVSVGYLVLDKGFQILRGGGRRLTRTEICELSLVTVPANMSATIDAIKSIDLQYLAATGATTPGVSGRPIGQKAMTNQERITQWENSRAAKVARMASIMEGATDTTLPEDRRTEYDDLALDVKGIDEHLVRARDLERLQAGSMARIDGSANGTTPARVPVVSVKSNLPPGTAFIRASMAILATKSRYEAIEYAKRWEKETPEVGLYLKAAVAAGNTTDPAWAGPLAPVTNVTSEIIELLRPATLLGRIPGLLRVPFNASVPIETGGGTYNWVGQGLAKPVTAMSFSSARLEVSKAAGIVALTEELVRLSSPSAEATVSRLMVRGITQFLDGQFIDPAVAYVANLHPASITNGIVGTASTQDPFQDLYALLAKFSAANVPLAGSVLILSETNAMAMGALRDAMGARLFPGVSANGGVAEGFTVIATNTAGTNVILVQPSGILYADEGQVTVDTSREASVIMDSAPDPATGQYVSLWQNNLVGLRAERWINWKRAIDSYVALVTGAQYPPVASPTAAGTPGAARTKQ